MQADITELETKAREAKAASRKLANTSSDIKNKALLTMARDLIKRKEEILAANKQDCDTAKDSGMDAAMLDRLLLNDDRIAGIASDVRSVAALPDPIGEMIEMRTLPNGLLLGRKRVPLGVIATIYESRPNVTIDISTLCLKSGNAIILRGGKEAFHSNMTLVKIARDACYGNGIPAGAIQFIESRERSLISHVLTMKNVIDLVIPRGGAELVNMVRENATMPVLAGGVGVCHTYVDSEANLDWATAIVYNAKVQRPTVCNALDCIIVHKDIAARYLPMMARELNKAGVELHCDEQSLQILHSIASLKIKPAVDEDWGKEFLSLVAAVKVVDSLDEALEYIERYGSGHSEAIITENYNSAMRFLNEVDAAAVYANASTRFTDGAQFGLGAEVGISTQKFHARGPMGLRELTSYKWIVFGNGHVRP